MNATVIHATPDASSTAPLSVCNKAIEILQATDDGDALAPSDLALVESAVNGFLTPTGVVAFEDLYAKVRIGEIPHRWLHGVEHLTKDHQGNVAWRGKVIEHFSHKDAEGEFFAALDLGARCRSAECRGFQVTSRSISTFSPFALAPANTPWVEAMSRYYTVFARPDGACRWLVLTTPEDDAIAVSVLDAIDVSQLSLPITSIGEICTQYARHSSVESGAYLMFHRLQDEGYVSAGTRLHTYKGFVAAMNEASLTPEIIARALAAGLPPG